MTDYFALLKQPRRPWLDSATLKEAYLSASREARPLEVGSSRRAGQAPQHGVPGSAEINAAFSCLKAHRARILHLLELETGSRPQLVREVPAELTDLFMRMTQEMRETDAFLKGWATATGLVRAQQFATLQDRVEKLQALQADLNGRTAELEQRLLELDGAWEDRNEGFLKRLTELCQLFSYYERWSSQVQERLTQLAM